MRKLKHSKYKNPAILFELLARQMTADVLQGNDTSHANKLLRKFFSESTELGKEYRLYNILAEQTVKSEGVADRLIGSVRSARKKLNEKVLLEEKYSLIKEIKAIYPIEDFLRGNIGNYKLLASIYKVFEEGVSSAICDPNELSDAHTCIVEHLSAKSAIVDQSQEKTTAMTVYEQENKDVKALAYKLLLSSFNEKYACLSEKQSTLLREYINNISNTNSLKNYIAQEVPAVKNQLSVLTEGVKNSVIKIKLLETISQLDKLTRGQVVKDNHVLALMSAYELITEVKAVI